MRAFYPGDPARRATAAPRRSAPRDRIESPAERGLAGIKLKRFALFVVLGLLTRGILFGAVPIGDEPVHLLGSWQLLRGKLLYVDFADNKPPLIYLYYAILQLLLGRGMTAVQVGTAGLTVPLTALGLSAFFRHDRAGLWAGLLYLVFGSSYLADEVLAVNTEPLMLLPAAWAFALVRSEDEAQRPARAALSGVLLGLAALFKTTAAPWLLVPPLAFVLAWRKAPRLTATLASFAGFLLPLGVTLGFFAARGALGELLYWNVVHNRAYAANPLPASLALDGAVTNMAPWAAATAPLLFAAWRGQRELGSPYRILLVRLCALLALPAVLVGLRFYGHYMVQLLLPLCLAAAPCAAALFSERPLGRVAKAWAAVTLFFLLGFSAANLTLFRLRHDVYEETRPIFDAVARSLETHACGRDDTLFVWGFAPMFYTASRLPPASRFVVPQARLMGFIPGSSARLPPAAPETSDPALWDLLMQDLERNHATFILDTSWSGFHRWNRFPVSDYPRLASYLRQKYEQVDAVDGVVVYRRRGCG